jgi:TRAP-type C4-dicarboxylate transport system permease small subunit
VRAFERAWRRLLEALAAAAALLLGATAVAVTADVVSRNVGLGAFPWILEGSEYALPLATFLAAPWLLARNEHVRLDVLLRVLAPRKARVLERATDALGFAVCAVFVVYGVRTALESSRQGSMVMKSLVFPEWWLFVPVPLCFALLAVEFARRFAAGEVSVGTGPHA